MMTHGSRTVLCLLFVAFGLTVTGCSSKQASSQPPMTQAQVDQKLQSIASNPNMPTEAREAAQHGLNEAQAQNMMDGGQ